MKNTVGGEGLSGPPNPARPLDAHPVFFGPGWGGRKGLSYLVDSASSHMLVSKIKPCMSKYTQIIL